MYLENPTAPLDRKSARQAAISLSGKLISIRSFTGWDFRSGSELLKTVIKILSLARKNVTCLFFLVVTFSQKQLIKLLSYWNIKNTQVFSSVTINRRRSYLLRAPSAAKIIQEKRAWCHTQNGWLHCHWLPLIVAVYLFQQQAKECITPTAVIFHDVLKLVSQMANPLKTCFSIEHGRSPGSPLVCRFFSSKAWIRSRHHCCYFRKPLLALLCCKWSVVLKKQCKAT